MSVRETIERSVRARRRGEPFTSADFKKVGPPAMVRSELERLAQAGRTKVVEDDLFVKPKINKLFGEVPPSVYSVVRALTVKHGHVFQITGGAAANRLGLSTQVPVREIYLTSAPSRRLKLGKLEVELRHKPIEELPAAGQMAGDVIQALDYFGPQAVEARHISRLSEILDLKTKARLRRLGGRLPIWMREVIEQF